ncbi:MAG: hypothetical protein ACLU6O_15095, partial [Bilophila wadsworthia]
MRQHLAEEQVPLPAHAADGEGQAGRTPEGIGGRNVDDLWSMGKRDGFESRFLVGARDGKGLVRSHL